MLNKVCLIGNVGKDPEIRSTQNGTDVANFSLAVSERWKDKSGERQEKTEWVSITVWTEGLIRVIKSYVNKGDRLYLEGKLQTRKWQDKEGNDRYTTEVVLSGFDAKLIMLSARKDDSGGGGGHGGETQGGSSYRSDVDEDSIPF